jgi:hypothetical protein
MATVRRLRADFGSYAVGFHDVSPRTRELDLALVRSVRLIGP